jgi:hypothetical protein
MSDGAIITEGTETPVQFDGVTGEPLVQRELKTTVAGALLVGLEGVGLVLIAYWIAVPATLQADWFGVLAAVLCALVVVGLCETLRRLLVLIARIFPRVADRANLGTRTELLWRRSAVVKRADAPADRESLSDVRAA